MRNKYLKILLGLIFFLAVSSVFADEWRICLGSFKNKSNAVTQAALLEKNGIPVYVEPFKQSNGQVLYRVLYDEVITDEKSAIRHKRLIQSLPAVKSLGINDVWCLHYGESSKKVKDDVKPEEKTVPEMKAAENKVEETKVEEKAEPEVDEKPVKKTVETPVEKEEKTLTEKKSSSKGNKAPVNKIAEKLVKPSKVEATSPVVEEVAPVVEELPVVEEIPAEETAPAVEEAAPVVEEVAPVEEEATSAVEEAAPVVEEAAPVVEEVAPIVEEATSAVEEVAPAVEDVAPVVEEIPAEETAPAVEEAAPVVEEIPAVEEVAPVVEEAAPVVEEVAPVEEEATSAVEEAAPVVEEIPVVEEASPAVEEVAPVEEDDGLVNPDEHPEASEDTDEEVTIEEDKSEIITLPVEVSPLYVQIVSAEDGNPVSSATLTLENKWNLITDDLGRAYIPEQIANGYYHMVISKNGFMTTKSYLMLSLDREVVSSKQIAIPEEKDEPGIKIVLEWGSFPEDLDAHILSSKEHAYFGSEESDSLYLDVESRHGFGPEAVSILNVDEKETYRFFVYDYSNESNPESMELSYSYAHVTVYINNEYKGTYNITRGRPGFVWHVLNIVNGNEVVLVDNLSSDKDLLK